MKNKNIISSFLVLLLLLSCGTQAEASANSEKEKTTFKVRGNCDMCKENIETAANSVKGVSSAYWNKEKEALTIKYNTAVTNVEQVEQAIANAGYDTQNKVGDKKVYNNLPMCCKYSDKK